MSEKEIKDLIDSMNKEDFIYSLVIAKAYEKLKEENRHYKKVINHLSRVIQNKNKKYEKLLNRKMPPTLYGREVIIVPDSIANNIMIVKKEFFENYYMEDMK